jgi:hypothetical protein
MEFPILNHACVLAGWSKRAPHFQGTELRHPDAEALIGRPLVIMPVRMRDPAAVKRCNGSEGGWCLAITPPGCIAKMPLTLE